MVPYYASKLLKIQTNPAAGISVMSYPLQIDFRRILCEMAEIKVLEKIVITPERYKTETSTLCRSKEDSFAYKIVIYKLKFKYKNY